MSLRRILGLCVMALSGVPYVIFLMYEWNNTQIWVAGVTLALIILTCISAAFVLFCPLHRGGIVMMMVVLLLNIILPLFVVKVVSSAFSRDSSAYFAGTLHEW